MTQIYNVYSMSETHSTNFNSPVLTVLIISSIMLFDIYTVRPMSVFYDLMAKSLLQVLCLC